ncbi:MAG: hypothetical protein ABUS51_09805 [Acidobacteriota bacterium]
MRQVFRITALLVLALPPVPADEIPAHILNLARIERKMTAELKRLPDYTCLETISRYTAAQGGKMKPYDRIRIDVAIVDGKELYSWPGAKSFDDRGLGAMVNNGFLSDGDFSAMSRNIFMHRTAAITFAGEVAEGSRNLFRYDFHIPQRVSGWQLRARNSTGVVGAKGSFWVDAGTLDLVRLRFSAEDLPPFSQDKGLDEDAAYGRVRIGSEEVLLPLVVDLESESFNGTRYLNHATFSGCRQYGSESTISFADGATPAPAPMPALPPREDAALPGGIEIALRLDTPIDSAHAAVGDEIRAVVSKAVKFGEEVVLPRGAVVSGVIRRLDRHTGNVPYYEVGLEFNEAESGGRRVVVLGKPGDVTPFTGFHRNAVGFATVAGDRPSPGVGYFYVEGESIRIPRGVSFTLLTQNVRAR